MRGVSVKEGISMKKMISLMLGAVVLCGVNGVILSATAPDRVNYQGVLRDDSDAPLDGEFDMVFRFYDTAEGGDPLLTDSHLAAVTGPVTVSGGLFNVHLGGGSITSGGPGLPESLAEVFRDYETVHLEVQVEAEVLVPRVRIVSSAYALNADHLDGRDSTSFIDTSASTQEKTGLLIASGGVDLGAGSDDDLTAADVEILTGGSSADTLHVHDVVPSAGDADTVDGLEAHQFLRSDISDSFTGGTLQVSGGSTLEVLGSLALNGSMQMNGDGPESDQVIYFYDDGSAFGESLRWEESQDRFELSNELAIAGPMRVGSTGAAPAAHSHFGLGEPENAAGVNDVYVTGSLEIDSNLYVGSILYMRDEGPDQSQYIGFYEDGVVGLEQLLWDDGEDRFEFTDSLALAGNLDLGAGSDDDLTAADVTLLTGGVSADSLHVHDFVESSGNADLLDSLDSADFLRSNINDSYGGPTLTIKGGSVLDVNGDLTLNGSLSMDDNGPDGNQAIYFYDGGSSTGQRVEWDDTDGRFEVSQALAVDGPIRVGSSTAPPVAYNHIGAGGPDSGDMANSGDLYVANDFELDGTLYLNGGLRMNDDGPDGSQSIYFFDDGSPTDEYIRWEDGNTRFLLSSAVRIQGNVTAEGNGMIIGNQLMLNSGGPDEDTNIYIYDGASTTGELFQWDDSADRFEFSDDTHVFGQLTATTKSFVQNHPYRDDLEVVYTSLEGDEAATFTRGFGRLRNGVARIALGRTFALVTNPDIGLSAHVTPRGQWADLYVESVTTEELVVRSPDAGSRDAVFDYIVYGLRIGFEELPVLREKRAQAFVPPPGYYESEYLVHPELKLHTALERYEAIGEHDPTVDVPAGSMSSVAQTALPPTEDEATGVESAASGLAGVERLVGDLDAASIPGQAAAGLSSRVFQDEQGNLFARSFRPEAGGLAGYYPVTRPVEVGDVLVIDLDRPGAMRPADRSSDPAVVGVVTGEPGLVTDDGGRGVERGEGDPTILESASEPVGTGEDVLVRAPVAVSGIVPCKVDASYGAIRVGDLLTTSPTEGRAMRTLDPLPGTVLGKALEPLDVGTGLIKVLVTLR
jgi:hypothetical protein